MEGPRPMRTDAAGTTHPTAMPTRQLGSSGPTVSMIGLGCVGMSGMYGERDDDESTATIRPRHRFGDHRARHTRLLRRRPRRDAHPPCDRRYRPLGRAAQRHVRRHARTRWPWEKASWTPWFSGMSQKSMIRPSGPKQTESRWHATVRVPSQKSAARVPAFCVRHRARDARSVRTI
jgi:hypothetical protein